MRVHYILLFIAIFLSFIFQSECRPLQATNQSTKDRRELEDILLTSLLKIVVKSAMKQVVKSIPSLV
ncbi:hypothetical protein JTE90_023568 [Oedothorax gibbosus]|uniref:Uncharacterized protein n=1 Tax=Oedothorax gibbosus TaxID=931172 RepID=A0AAV6UBL0_9ARAC|nr:hypothetical protein JTE90_023568 [Oedothorax gibbosus]